MDQADTLMTSISMAEGGVFYPNIFPFEDIQKRNKPFRTIFRNFIRKTDLTFKTSYDLVKQTGKKRVSIKKLAIDKGFY